MDQGSSLLLGIDGLVVDRVLIDESGRRVVHCSTDPELAGWCPACRQQSSSPKERVTTRPRDVRIGPGSASVVVAQTEMALPGAGVRAEGWAMADEARPARPSASPAAPRSTL